MIASLSLILLCQLAGEVTVRGLGLPMPGPVVGLLLSRPMMFHVIGLTVRVVAALTNVDKTRHNNALTAVSIFRICNFAP